MVCSYLFLALFLSDPLDLEEPDESEELEELDDDLDDDELLDDLELSLELLLLLEDLELGRGIKCKGLISQDMKIQVCCLPSTGRTIAARISSFLLCIFCFTIHGVLFIFAIFARPVLSVVTGFAVFARFFVRPKIIKNNASQTLKHEETWTIMLTIRMQKMNAELLTLFQNENGFNPGMF